MTTAIAPIPAPQSADPFGLHITVHTDVPATDLNAPCGTGDGCAPTCASSCITSAQ